jgi:hypothetical protein
MRVARQTPAAAAGCLVFQLKAEGEDESHDQFGKGLAVAKRLKIGRLIMEIDADRAVLPSPWVALPNGSPPDHRVS